MNANFVDYYLIITYPGQGKQHLMSGPDRAIASTEENVKFLLSMGERLLDENVIASYQLVKVASKEFSRSNQHE